MRGQAELAALHDELAAQQAELSGSLAAKSTWQPMRRAAWQAVGTQRWADPDGDDDHEKR